MAYEAAEKFGAAYGRRVGSAGFMKSLMTQRLCSSCTAGLRTARKILEGSEIDDDAEELREISGEGISDEEKFHLRALIDSLQRMRERDPKLKAVLHYLKEENWFGYGCIIFSQYYATASWIAGNLAKVYPDDLVGLYAGAGKSALYRGSDNRNETEREDLKHLVEEEAIKIMVATDAACEGLNLVYRDTVDEKIYERLSERMKDRFDIIGSLPDTIIDDWIENEALIGQKMDEYIEARKKVNGFDIRYNANLDAAEDEWRSCTQVLSRRSIDSFMRKGWFVKGL